jgi:hypothetical protein
MSVFVVKVRDETFELTEAQLAADSPSFLTTAFSGDWQEKQSGSLVLLEQHPDHFRLIVEHLSGYGLFPLDGPTHTHRKRLNNLKVDAEFFALEGLLRRIAKEGARRFLSKNDADRDCRCSDSSRRGREGGSGQGHDRSRSSSPSAAFQ